MILSLGSVTWKAWASYFEVDDLQAFVLKVVEGGGEELLEAHDGDPAPHVEEVLHLRGEVGVMAREDHRAGLEFGDRVHRALEADVDDLHVLRARQRDHRVVHRVEGLDEAHRQDAGGSVEEEEALGGFVPLVRRRFEDAVPAGSFFGQGAPVEDRHPQGRVDVLAVNDQISLFAHRCHHGTSLERPAFSARPAVGRPRSALPRCARFAGIRRREAAGAGRFRRTGPAPARA